MDYRKLNSVTKADTFPLPRIDDLLDELCKSEYFSTLDFAAGFWQIKVHSPSQEKLPSLPLRDCLSLELCRSV